MKARLFPVFILLLLVSCSRTKSSGTSEQQPEPPVIKTTGETQQNPVNIAEPSNQNQSCCIPDSNMFLFRKIDRTIDVGDNTIKNLTDLSREQINNWLISIAQRIKSDIRIASGNYYKAVSFQKKTENYYSIILMRITGFSLDEYNGLEQFLITISNTGKIIDGIFVQRGEDDGGEFDSTRNALIGATDIRSVFSGDTIKTYQMYNFTHTEYKNEWQDLYETLYLIQPDGKIANIRERKKIKDSRESDQK